VSGYWHVPIEGAVYKTVGFSVRNFRKTRTWRSALRVAAAAIAPGHACTLSCKGLVVLTDEQQVVVFGEVGEIPGVEGCQR